MRKRILSSVDPVYSKQNDQVLMFANEVSEYRRVSTTRHPASIMMLSVVASNGEKMLPVWFERGYRLTHCRLRRSFGDESSCIGSRRSLNNTLRLPTWRSACTHGKYCAGLVGRQYELLVPTVTRFEPTWLQLWTNIEENFCKTRHRNTNKPKASVNCTWRSMRKGFVRKVCKSFRPRLERVIAIKGGHIE